MVVTIVPQQENWSATQVSDSMNSEHGPYSYFLSWAPTSYPLTLAVRPCVLHLLK